MNAKRSLPSWLPLVIGGLLVLQFLGLGAWQVSRGFEKREIQAQYNTTDGFAAWRPGDPVRSFQRIQVSGTADAARQVVLDNIIVASQYGHYVITPFDVGIDQPLLLVNRGWVEKTAFAGNDLSLPDGKLTLRGRAGSLPRAGYKMGDAFAESGDWPRHAVYPAAEDVARELGRDVQPFVLLLAPDEAHGYYRHWTPTEFGPGKHFGYALQWFAMAAILAGLLAWNYRKGKFA